MSSWNLGSKPTGRLSTQKKPRSSRARRKVPFPEPLRPVMMMKEDGCMEHPLLSEATNLSNLGKGNFEIGRILHLKSEIRNCKLDCRDSVRSEISKFRI